MDPNCRNQSGCVPGYPSNPPSPDGLTPYRANQCGSLCSEYMFTAPGGLGQPKVLPEMFSLKLSYTTCILEIAVRLHVINELNNKKRVGNGYSQNYILLMGTPIFIFDQLLNTVAGTILRCDCSSLALGRVLTGIMTDIYERALDISGRPRPAN